MALGEFEIYTHQEVSIVTIDGFLQRKDSIAGAFKDNMDDFIESSHALFEEVATNQ